MITKLFLVFDNKLFLSTANNLFAQSFAHSPRMSVTFLSVHRGAMNMQILKTFLCGRTKPFSRIRQASTDSSLIRQQSGLTAVSRKWSRLTAVTLDSCQPDSGQTSCTGILTAVKGDRGQPWPRSTLTTFYWQLSTLTAVELDRCQWTPAV